MAGNNRDSIRGLDDRPTGVPASWWVSGISLSVTRTCWTVNPSLHPRKRSGDITYIWAELRWQYLVIAPSRLGLLL